MMQVSWQAQCFVHLDVGEDFVAGATLVDLTSWQVQHWWSLWVDFVAGAVLVILWSLSRARRSACGPGADFMAGATLCVELEVQISWQMQYILWTLKCRFHGAVLCGP